MFKLTNQTRFVQPIKPVINQRPVDESRGFWEVTGIVDSGLHVPVRILPGSGSITYIRTPNGCSKQLRTHVLVL